VQPEQPLGQGVGALGLHELPTLEAELDRSLNDRKYIVRGLSQFGDRLYGT
jgi:uracil phosphoribosyltransferase